MNFQGFISDIIENQWKQKCYCLPERGLMITFLSHMEEKLDALTRSMEKYILGMEE